MGERPGAEKGRTSRASSTSSLGREVRCGCQFYQSDSLLPERKALVGRPPSRNTMQTPPPTTHNQQQANSSSASPGLLQEAAAGRCEHEYEPIGSPSMLATMSTLKKGPSAAPVVRINDTDVVHVADSDDSLDVQERRYSPNNQLLLDGDVIVPLDGEIEDNAMQARELGETVDTSEDQETAQQLQDRLEERFLNAATPCTESRTDAEINTSQVDSSALEELPLRRGARGFPQRLRSQAGKLRSRLRGIQRPNFSLPERQKKTEKTKTTKVEKPKPAKPAKPAKAEKSRFSLPERPKFSLPERPKFNLPERPKFNFPERPKFNLPERPKFNIKRPNINLPTLGRVRKPLKERQNSNESQTSGSKRNIFDFSTYPRLFDKKSKSRGDYATSSPKQSRAQSPEIATVPRVKKKAPIGARWVQRFSDIKYADDDVPESAAERSKPWRHPSIEEPQVAFRQETEESHDRLPWEESEDRSTEEPRHEPHEEPIQEIITRVQDARYDDEDSVEIENRRIIVPLGQGFADDLEDEIPEDVTERRLYPRGLEEDQDSFEDHARTLKGVKEKWLHGSNEVEEVEDVEDQPEEDAEVMDNQESYGPEEEYSGEMNREDDYGGDFMPIDPPRKIYLPREPTPEETSVRSDREQQSSGSSSDRRRRGVLEEIDSDEFFLRAKGISQDDMNMGRFLASEIRDAFRPTGNALADHHLDIDPPTRPVRTRSLRKRRDENPPGSYDATPPARPKRDRRRSEESLRADEYRNYLPGKTGSISSSRHRVIYQTEGIPGAVEPLDDIVVVKPARRKSRSVARSNSEFGSGVLQHPPMPSTPPVAPRRRKRGRRDPEPDLDAHYVNGHGPEAAICNGHRQEMDWREGASFPTEVRNDPDQLLSEEQLRTFVDRLDHEYIEPAPVAPKRRSRSRGTSVADDDRTSRGAESLPEVSYLEEGEAEEARRDAESRDLPGYAVVDKREKPPRPPPPRRRRDKFATCPKPATSSTPAVPVRPIRAYSTLGPSRRRSTSEDRSINQMDVTPYTELDSDDPDLPDLRSAPVLEKIQGRPLPAPPRPPRSRRDAADQISVASNGVVEVAASTQTDPLPDDLVIEEEVTRAKLVMAPSRSGSQIMVSTERIATPTFGRNSPAVPPLPQSMDRDYRTRNSPSPVSDEFVEPHEEAEGEKVEEKVSAGTDLVLDERTATPVTPSTSIPLVHEDRIRIASLEVADLRVERLNVGQIEAHKISASEVDAVVVSASEISTTSNPTESEIHPSLLRELIAIRSHLELVASARQGREATPETRGRNETATVVEELIESLKKSDRGEEEAQDFMEESEVPEEQTETDAGLGQENSNKEEKVDQEVSKKEQEAKESIEEVKIQEETSVSIEVVEPEPKVEETKDSEAVEKTAEPEIDVPSPPAEESLQKTAETKIPRILTPVEEQNRGQGQPSIRDAAQDDKRKSSRSRSSSPSKDGKRFVRQTASPVKSLPPLISVTPDIPDPVPSPIPEAPAQPQRAIVSYAENNEDEISHRLPNTGVTQYVAFPTSQIPANFFSLASPRGTRFEPEPSIVDMTQQLLRAIRLAGTRAMRHFVGYVASRVSTEDRGEKTKEIELALCALLLLIAGLLILCFGSPRTVTHHHHWDFLNPPQ